VASDDDCTLSKQRSDLRQCCSKRYARRACRAEGSTCGVVRSESFAWTNRTVDFRNPKPGHGNPLGCLATDDAGSHGGESSCTSGPSVQSTAARADSPHHYRGQPRPHWRGQCPTPLQPRKGTTPPLSPNAGRAPPLVNTLPYRFHLGYTHTGVHPYWGTPILGYTHTGYQMLLSCGNGFGGRSPT
jgi:hypothetical protein